MITLCMDTSSTFLVLALIKDHQLIGHVQKSCWKHQSEEIFPELTAMMDRNGLKPSEIDQVVVSKGPGSYTGVRIAMTIAKVFCAMGNKPIYTIPTLQLYAGKAPHVRVLLDARGQRAYTAVYDNGQLQGDVSVQACADLIDACAGETIFGDGHLVNKEDVWPDLAQHFLDLEDQWHLEPNVHLVKPVYLKSTTAYLTGIH